MRTRSKTLLALWVGCLVTGMFASGAVAHGGGHGGKSGEGSKGKSALKVEIRGTITAVTPGVDPTHPGSITVTANAPAAPVGPVTLEVAPAPISFTCNIPAGTDPADLTDFVLGAHVKAKCRSTDTGLTFKRLRLSDSTRDKVEVEARGTVSLLTADSITVQPGVGLPDVTCAIGPRTRIKGTPVAGDTVKIECKSRDGVLTAKKIKARGPKAAPLGTKVEVKGAITAISTVVPASITVGPVVCSVADPTLLGTLVVGDIVEMKCAGDPLALLRIHPED